MLKKKELQNIQLGGGKIEEPTSSSGLAQLRKPTRRKTIWPTAYLVIILKLISLHLIVENDSSNYFERMLVERRAHCARVWLFRDAASHIFRILGFFSPVQGFKRFCRRKDGIREIPYTKTEPPRHQSLPWSK